MNRVVIGVKGQRACFTMSSVSKQNRFSFPVITPSAARGVLSSVFLKPEFDWVVTRIAVMKMGRSDTVTVNEIRFPNGGNKPISAVENRIQSTMRILRDVDYVIEAEPFVLNPGTQESPNTPMKYVAEFEKRINGKKPFWKTPCLGLREFVGKVYPVESFPVRGCEMPDMSLPAMLVGLSHPDQRKDGGVTHPCFMDLKMIDGIIGVPWFCGATYKVGEAI